VQRYGLALATAPTVEPISTSEAKAHLRVDISEDDTYIDTLIKAARTYCENYLFRRLINSTWDLYLDSFPGEILLPYPPAVSISSITYVDGNGDSQTLASTEYVVDIRREPGRLYPAYSKSWPSVRNQNNAVTVRYVAGYGAAASNVPAAIVHAMKLLVGTWYEQRESILVGTIVSQVPDAVQNLLWSHRVLEIH